MRPITQGGELYVCGVCYLLPIACADPGGGGGRGSLYLPNIVP